MGDDARTQGPSDPAEPTAPAGQQEGTDPENEAADAGTVLRSVEIEAPADDVWEAISDPDRRSAWLDDDDALARVTRIDGIDPGRSLTWTWWHPDEVERATQVQVTLDEPVAGTTRVTVVEHRPDFDSRTGGLNAHASVVAAAGTATARAWDYRLLGLALLFVAACVRV